MWWSVNNIRRAPSGQCQGLQSDKEVCSEKGKRSKWVVDTITECEATVILIYIQLLALGNKGSARACIEDVESVVKKTRGHTPIPMRR
jgi:hypothetical protein